MKKSIDKQKYAWIIIVFIVLLSSFSVWCVMPKNKTLENDCFIIDNIKVDCVAQGHYKPKPIEQVKSPTSPNEVENEEMFLCSGQGHYKPQPLKPDDDDPQGD